MTLRCSCLVTALCLSAALTTSEAAASTATSDAQAVAILTKALAALNGATVLTDATVPATATYIAGGDTETGTATLEAKANKSRVALNLSGGQRLEIRNGAAGDWIGPDGILHPMAKRYCWTDATWFFPGLTLQTSISDPQVVAVYVGLETRNGGAVQHLQLFRIDPLQPAGMTAEIQSLSTLDLYLGAQTYLPVALDFNMHPDDNFGVNIPVEIQFSDYRSTKNVTAPFHIQKLLQNTLLFDLTVTSITINSGIPDTEFTVQ